VGPELAQGEPLQALHLIATQAHPISNLTEADHVSIPITQRQDLLLPGTQTPNHLVQPPIVIIRLLKPAIPDRLKQRTTGLSGIEPLIQRSEARELECTQHEAEPFRLFL
jgi:hypothetical protein